MKWGGGDLNLHVCVPVCPCVRLCSEDICLTAQPFVTRPDTCGGESSWAGVSCKKRKKKKKKEKKKSPNKASTRNYKKSYLQVQGHSDGLYNQDMTVFTIKCYNFIS